ncbi:OVARIAN TUMOR DOMAIN-containing deubiquitinating enzyme 12 isoform X2 [Brassica napus]|uniref:OVARIAN TUMOR DOMAIN-containing deubiquitinating enzyme 12 isoform X2 n=1 Tax=Brassica napus TaxID=3708 RepID=UPI002078C094|nr:OVARIAN TUMOR DOMAIN-containing deubiquitinating enzyme 12 isoform X2 [Brassica napus]
MDLVPVSVLGAHIPFRTSFPSYYVVFVLLLQLKDNRTIYESYVPMKYKRYYKRMAKLGEWGDHITLQAAADRFAAKICLLTSFRDTCFIEIMPQDQAPKQLWLSFWSEVHYNSLYDNQAVPVQQKPKRKHWWF